MQKPSASQPTAKMDAVGHPLAAPSQLGIIRLRRVMPKPDPALFATFTVEGPNQ